jgi:hypothetical protein
MSVTMYRSQHKQKSQSQAAAAKQAAELRRKEAAKRHEAAKAYESASKTSSPSTQKMRLSAANSAVAAANKYGKDAADLEAKAAKYGVEVANLSEKLSKAELAEANSAERKRKAAADQAERRRKSEADRAERERKAEQLKAEQEAAAQRLSLEQRINWTEAKADHALRQLSKPKRERLRVLMLAASPEGDLRLGREQGKIQRAVEATLHRDYVDLRLCPSATTDDLLDGITKFRPHVVHFSGHSDDRVIEFEADVDDFHKGVIVTAEAFANACKATDEPPTLIVLNSCESAPQADALVDLFAPLAIGMTGTIDDSDAITYATRLYAAIANGQSVNSAHLSARAAVQILGGDHDRPHLAVAGDVDASQVMLVKVPDEDH